MPTILFVVCFAMLVLLPCAVASSGLRLESFGFGDLDGFAFTAPRALGLKAAPLCAYGDERPVVETFVIRSFEKGLSAKRRLLVRDGSPAVAAILTVAAEITAQAVTTVYPRSRRRVQMLQMVEARAEADAWTQRAQAARAQLARMQGSSPELISLSQSIALEAYKAEAAAADALRRLGRLEATLQHRADAEISAPAELRALTTARRAA